MHLHSSKIMLHMKFIYFFNANLDFFKSAHFKNFLPHEQKKLDRTLISVMVEDSVDVRVG